MIDFYVLFLGRFILIAKNVLFEYAGQNFSLFFFVVSGLEIMLSLLLHGKVISLHHFTVRDESVCLFAFSKQFSPLRNGL